MPPSFVQHAATAPAFLPRPEGALRSGKESPSPTSARSRQSDIRPSCRRAFLRAAPQPAPRQPEPARVARARIARKGAAEARLAGARSRLRVSKSKSPWRTLARDDGARHEDGFARRESNNSRIGLAPNFPKSARLRARGCGPVNRFIVAKSHAALCSMAGTSSRR